MESVEARQGAGDNHMPVIVRREGGANRKALNHFGTSGDLMGGRCAQVVGGRKAASGLRWAWQTPLVGSFTAVKAEYGVSAFHFPFPSCDLEPGTWTATCNLEPVISDP